jgi:hypothetical protein
VDSELHGSVRHLLQIFRKSVAICGVQHSVNMTTLPSLFRSLLLTSIFSFLGPVLLLVLLLLGALGISYLPALEAFGTGSLEQITHFLQTFGSGSGWRGVIVIGLVGSLVGVLFDTYTFYQSQHLRGHRS